LGKNQEGVGCGGGNRSSEAAALVVENIERLPALETETRF